MSNDKISKYKKNIKRVAMLILLCIAVIGTLSCYADMLDDRLSSEIKNTLKEVSEQNALTIKTEIKSQETSLLEIAERIGDIKNLDLKEIDNMLKEISSRYTFKRMGIIMPDGTAYTTDHIAMNLSKREYFKNALKGKNCISSRLEDYSGGEIIVFSSPIYIDGKVEAVLFGTYSIENLQKILAVSSFGGETYSYIIDRDGKLVVEPEVGTLRMEKNNFYGALDEMDIRNKDGIEYMQNRIADNRGGHVLFYTKEGVYLQFTQLGINDWYLLNLIPANAMDATKNYVMKITYLLSGAIILLFTLAVIYIIHIDRKKHRELSKILYVDPVTGGNSYQWFMEKLAEVLKGTERKAALLLMDIEDFKLINEIFGYEKGNMALKYISSLWKEWLLPEEIFARRIADRYVGLVFYDDKEQLLKRLENFIDILQSDTSEIKEGYILRPKFGIYLIKDNSENVQSMQNYVVIAHAMAKKKVGTHYLIYDGKFKEEMLRNKILEDQMQQAYKNCEFINYYQPKYDAKTQEVVGAEALVRWRKPDGTLISPGAFIPIAEKSRFIIKLDEYVFKKTCIQQRLWAEKGYKIVPISVNLSREHLYDDSFIDEYQQIRSENDLNDSDIELEITESAMFENQEEFCNIMDRLHVLKFKILMDDFGTGYSSLGMLKTIPIDVMKLDKTFIDDYNHPRGEKVITSVIQLAKIMNISVTAEGVETKEQYEFLKKMECDTIQGYYFARPMPTEDFEKLLNLAGKKHSAAK